MAQIITFPATRHTAAAAVPAVGSGLTAEVRHLTQPRPASVPAAPTNGAGSEVSLAELVERLRADAHDLHRSAADLRTAVQALVEADLPGQAWAIVDTMIAEDQPSRAGRRSA
jgi:hypothetical protein